MWPEGAGSALYFPFAVLLKDSIKLIIGFDGAYLISNLDFTHVESIEMLLAINAALLTYQFDPSEGSTMLLGKLCKPDSFRTVVLS